MAETFSPNVCDFFFFFEIMALKRYKKLALSEKMLKNCALTTNR